jgi:hypothetical protein
MGEGERLGIYLRCPAWSEHGSVERPEGYGARSRGSLPFLCSATVTGIVSDDEKRRPGQGRQGTAATNLRRPSLAGDALMARQPDSQTARQPDRETTS